MPRLLLLAAVSAMSASAASAGPLTVNAQVLAVRAGPAAARPVLTPVKRAVPGDRVIVALDYRNRGGVPLSNLVFDNPVPAGLSYRAATAGTPEPDVSVDGVVYGRLATLTIRTAEGTTRAATGDDVRHVRWRLGTPVAPGGEGRLSFDATLK